MGRVLLAGLPGAERAAHLERVRLEPLTPFTLTSRQELAAVLEGVARDGYALVDQELEEGLRSLAVPVRTRDGRVLAAVNVALHAGRGGAEQSREALLPALRETSRRIEADLHLVARRGALRTA
jgi:IclR family pca regulon transcriptional regulator